MARDRYRGWGLNGRGADCYAVSEVLRLPNNGEAYPLSLIRMLIPYERIPKTRRGIERILLALDSLVSDGVAVEMKAEYTFEGSLRSKSIWYEKREDGSAGPPKRFVVHERSSPSSPVVPITLELESIDVERDVALYRLIGRI
jgi:hypothetical protein